MEFVTSKAMAFLCGAVLLAAVAVPMADMYSKKADDGMSRAAASAARAIDAFWDSEADAMTLRGSDMLPFPDCALELDGHMLTICRDGKEYRAAMAHPAAKASMAYGDTATARRDGGVLVVADQ